MEPQAPVVVTLRLDASRVREPRTLMHLSWSQVQRFADDFDLGRLIQMDRPLTTQCNTTDPFRTGQGTFMLRARHSEEYGERVEYLHSLIDYLVAHGFPAPQVMRSRFGKSWTTWGERIVEIHRFVPHDPGIHRDWQRMNSAATALADLHRMLAEASVGKTPVPPEMRNDVNPEQCWSLLSEAETTIPEMHSVPAEQAVEAVEILQRGRAALEPLLKDYSRQIGSVPWMVVHGDFHFWNVLYRGDEIAAVVDYDFVQERERLFDIAYALQNVVAHMRQVHGWTGGQPPGELPWRNVRLWLDQYDAATHLPMTAAEREWLPKEILRIFLVNLATGILQEDAMDSILRVGRELDLFLWIGDQKALFS